MDFSIRTHSILIARALLALTLVAAVWGCGPSGVVAGAKAPEISVEPLSDRTKLAKLPDFKGKVVMIDFWATWCGPCRETAPKVNEFYQKYKDKGLVALAITNEARGTVESFASQAPHMVPIYLDTDNSVNEAYMVAGIPDLVIIDRKGVIRFRGHPGLTKDVEAALEAAVNEAP